MISIKPACSAHISAWSKAITLLAAGLLLPLDAQADLSGNLAVEWRAYTRSPAVAEQTRQQFSLSGQAEWNRVWDEDKQRITCTPFARIDSADAERTHADIRELSYLRVGEQHEWRVGLRKVFWGVTESQHLVDIINQTDLVEDPDGEEKFGQPMFNLALLGEWGSVDGFVLPGIRERSFPGVKGRLRPALPVDAARSTYDAANRRAHTDLALRWAKSTGTFDSGLSYFYGTSREPRFNVVFDNAGQAVLAPHYDLIRQWGVDLQTVQGAALWKLEAIRRSGQGASYSASTAGIEYTLADWLHSGKDVGLIAEHLYDNRGDTAMTPFQNDLMMGMRVGFNDADGSEALFGVIADRNSSTRVYSVETSRRIGDYWKWSLKARLFTDVAVNDLLYSLRRDDFVKLELARYF